MSVNVKSKKPFIVDSPHYITINVLEIAKLDMPIKEEVFIFDIDKTLYSNQLYLKQMIVEAEYVLSKYLNGSVEETNAIDPKIDPEISGEIKRCILDFQLPSKFYIDIHLRLFDQKYFKEDKILKEMLLELKKTKTLICFTTSNEINSRYILESLGVSEAFDLVITNDYQKASVKKPQKIAYDIVNMSLDLKEKTKKIIFFDDKLINCKVAEEVGWEGRHITLENDICSQLSLFIDDTLKIK